MFTLPVPVGAAGANPLALLVNTTYVVSVSTSAPHVAAPSADHLNI